MDTAPASDTRRRALALVITGAAVFMVTLDNLVVTNALPSIRADLGASISQLGWFVNAYTLTFAALLLTGASLGDRFGRRRVFALGLGIFTAGSLGAALATSSGLLITARSVQGLGAALVMPLSLTLLSAAFPDRRGLAIGIWSGLSGLAVALGPVVGGAVVDGLSWQWIFFLNVPIGILLAPFAYRVLDESHGPDGVLDVRGLVLASTGLLALVWGIVRGNDQGWLSAEILGALALAVALLAAFVAWERRAPAPMLPLRLFRSRAFSATNGVSLIMNFGIFGSIFLLAQFLQTVQGYSAFDAGVRTLPWTLMPMFIAPLAGLYSDRIGSRPLMFTGLALQATALGWLASVASPTVAYGSLIVPFVLAGIGMALVFAPVSNMILSSVSRSDEGKASGANNAIREVGGTLGVAVLASVFSREGNVLTGQGFVDGLVPAVWIGAVVLAAGALLALAVPGRRPERETADQAMPVAREPELAFDLSAS
jgi:EmrB/QacA subfamily drug resistance transporter